MSDAQKIHFLAPEDQARANLYGLLARLFHSPPDAALLQAIAQSGELQAEAASGLASAWKATVEASAAASAGTVREEYEQVFIGTGKAEVTLYVGAYTTRSTADSPLAQLRGELAELGLARREQAYEPEDHVAALCETMRHLIAEQHASLDRQQRFFQRWIAPAASALCAAVENSTRTFFYKFIGRLAREFFELEQAAFEMR